MRRKRTQSRVLRRPESRVIPQQLFRGGFRKPAQPFVFQHLYYPSVSLSVLFIVMFAKVVGSALPILAEKLGVDPAVMANPLISTVTDAVSLLIYIYVAKLILHI